MIKAYYDVRFPEEEKIHRVRYLDEYKSNPVFPMIKEYFHSVDPEKGIQCSKCKRRYCPHCAEGSTINRPVAETQGARYRVSTICVVCHNKRCVACDTLLYPKTTDCIISCSKTNRQVNKYYTYTQHCTQLLPLYGVFLCPSDKLCIEHEVNYKICKSLHHVTNCCKTKCPKLPWCELCKKALATQNSKKN